MSRKKIVPPKQFVLFMGKTNYPAGGMLDCVGSFDTREEALAVMTAEATRIGGNPSLLWAQLWDTQAAHTSVEMLAVERIVAAAIRFADGYVFHLPPPARHNDLIRELAERFEEARRTSSYEHGFLTSLGAFVDRRMAKRIAALADQLLPRALRHSELYSEDVW